MTSSKHIIISILTGVVVYLLIGLLRHQAIIIPDNAYDFGELLIIIAGIFTGCLIASRPAGPGGVDSEIERETGSVKWFNVKKGYGFITRDSGEDIFVHYQNINGNRRSISDGQRVSFIVVDGEKGLQANEVSSE